MMKQSGVDTVFELVLNVPGDGSVETIAEGVKAAITYATWNDIEGADALTWDALNGMSLRAVGPADWRPDERAIETYLDAARRHGEDDDPDHEVGDLQGHLRTMWKLLSPAQRAAFIADEDVHDVLVIGVGEEEADQAVRRMRSDAVNRPRSRNRQPGM